MMGALATAVMDAGGEVIGVIPRVLRDREYAFEGVTSLIVVESMAERHAVMTSLSEGFIALPGGYGTWEELFEVVTAVQLGFHTKRIGVLNRDGYYNALRELVRQAADKGYIYPGHHDIIRFEADPTKLVAYVLGDQPDTNAEHCEENRP